MHGLLTERPNAPPEAHPSVWIADDSAVEAELARKALAAPLSGGVLSDGAELIERLSEGVVPDALLLLLLTVHAGTA